MSKDDDRVAVLRFYYSYNERQPGGLEQTVAVAQATALEPAIVSEAQLYLLDKGLLHTTTTRQPLHGGYSSYMARITARGIDFVEHPSDFRGRDFPTALVNIVAQGDVSGITVAGRDQQVVHGDAIAVAQGDAASISVRPFPIDQLRSLVGTDADAQNAIDDIATEVTKSSPRWGRVVAAAETLRNATTLGEAGHILFDWFNQAHIPEWVQHAVGGVLGS